MERLIVKKFGPIDFVDIELKPITVFIGPQASGKSTIAKLISTFRKLDFAVKVSLDISDSADSFFGLLKHYNIDSFLNKDTYVKFCSEAFEYEFSEGKEIFKKNDTHPVFIAKKQYDEIRNSAKNAQLPEEGKIEEEIQDLEQSLEFLKQTEGDKDVEEAKAQIEEKRKLLEFIKNRNKASGAFFDEVITMENFSEYIPAERIFISMASGAFFNLAKNNVPLPSSVIDFGSEFEKARNDIKELSIDFLGVTYRYENEEDRIYISDSKFIKLRDSASGYQTLIPLLLVINNKYQPYVSGKTFVIEEPELNLFPSTQKALVMILIEKCTYVSIEYKKFNELVITTHSPYVLSVLNNLIFAKRVVKLNPESENKVSEVIDKKFWIDSDSFSAYLVKEGRVKNIVDPQTGLIFESELDNISQEINNEYGQLMDIYTSQE